ncbi:hypothetical protein LTR27_002571 [Elasticomyces elasticus]|nr:hypothetical protein LTR27_002571 [Elasticomyces elasticus]
MSHPQLPIPEGMAKPQKVHKKVRDAVAAAFATQGLAAINTFRGEERRWAIYWIAGHDVPVLAAAPAAISAGGATAASAATQVATPATTSKAAPVQPTGSVEGASYVALAVEALRQDKSPSRAPSSRGRTATPPPPPPQEVRTPGSGRKDARDSVQELASGASQATASLGVEQVEQTLQRSPEHSGGPLTLDDDSMPMQTDGDFGEQEPVGQGQQLGTDDAEEGDGDNDANLSRQADMAFWIPSTRLWSANPMRNLLNDSFGGEHGLPTDAAERQVGDCVVRLTRKLVLTMLDHAWYECGVVDALLKSHCPDPCELNTATRASLVATVDLERWINGEPTALMTEAQLVQEVLVGGFIQNVTLWEECDSLVGVVNEGDKHWIAMRAVKGTTRIEAYDSWIHDSEKDQKDRVALLETKLLRALDRMTRLQIVDQSWQDTNGRWTVHWMPTPMQANSDDCGAHAVRNAVDLWRSGSIMPFHDAAALRYRNVQRIRMFLSGALEAGADLPFEQELVDSWSSKRGPLTHSTAAPLNNGSGGLNSLQLAQQQQALFELAHSQAPSLTVPLAGSRIPIPTYREGIAAILHIAGGDGLTADEIYSRFVKYGELSGAKVGSISWSNFTPWSLRKMALFTENEDTQKWSLAPGKQLYVVPGARTWATQVDRSCTIQDAIRRRPNLVVLPVRLSSSSDATAELSLPDDPSDLMASAKRNLDYYISVHGSRAVQPTEITGAGQWSPDNWAYYRYPMIRSSRAPAFQHMGGSRTDEDVNIMAILQEMQDAARALVLSGVVAPGPNTDRPYSVEVVQVAVDGFTNDNASLARMSEQYPNLDVHISMLMPADRVLTHRHVFKVRDHDDHPQKSLAWASFDVHRVAHILSEVTSNPNAACQFEEEDQAALLHMNREAVEYKEAFSIVTALGDDIVDRRELFDGLGHGKSLLDGLRRHGILNGVVIRKRCWSCDLEFTTGMWHRSPEDDAHIVCDDCDRRPDPLNKARKRDGDAIGASDGDRGPGKRPRMNKVPWTPAEDRSLEEQLLAQFDASGKRTHRLAHAPDWAAIQLPRRTESGIRQRYHTVRRKDPLFGTPH